MARKKTKKRTARKTKTAHRTTKRRTKKTTRKTNQIPLSILEKRLVELNGIVKRRKGDSY